MAAPVKPQPTTSMLGEADISSESTNATVDRIPLHSKIFDRIVRTAHCMYGVLVERQGLLVGMCCTFWFCCIFVVTHSKLSSRTTTEKDDQNKTLTTQAANTSASSSRSVERESF